VAINTSWEIKIGSVASPTDFTSRVMSMNISQSVDVNVLGQGVCQITLLNKDGALTPGGGGTYSSTDWFAQGVFVAALTNTGGANTTTQVFHGVVTDFDLADDGVFSTVTITAVDGLTIAGRTTGFPYPTSGPITYSTAMVLTLSNSTYLKFPRLGQSAGAGGYSNLGDGDTDISITTTTFASAADLLQSGLVPSANDVAWPTVIEIVSGSITGYIVSALPVYNSRNVANTDNIEFAPQGSVTGTKLPFDNNTFRQSFNNQTLISTAIIDGLAAGTTEQTANSTAINTYGSRTVAFTSTFSETDTKSANMATKLVNRYGTSRFTPTEMQLSATLVKTRAADTAHSKWYNLLSITNGLWQRVTVTWTGSGAASQTAYCVIKGRTINVTPDDTLVTLSLGNWADNHSFILDTDQLDTDRLG